MPGTALQLLMLGLLLPFQGRSQSAAIPGTAAYAYHNPSADKLSWQRLNLCLSSTFLVVVAEGQVEHDTCLYIASRSLGLSRYAVLAEGIDDPALQEQSGWVDRQEPGAGVHLLTQTTGRKHLELLVLLGAYYAFQPGSYNRYLDSVQYFVHKAIPESKTLKEEKLGRQALCLLGKLYASANDPKANIIFNDLIDQCHTAGDLETEARAIAWRGIYLAPRQNTLLAKAADLRKAAELYHRLGNTEAEINVLTDLGYMLVVTGQLQTAQDIFLQALTKAEAIHFPYTHYNSEALAMVTFFQGKFGEPLQYSLQSVRVAERCHDSTGLGYFYTRLSELYNSEGQREKCLNIAQKAIDRFIMDHNPTVYNVLLVVVNNMYEQGHAREALDLAREVTRKVGMPSKVADLFFCYYTLSNCYLYVEDLDMAELYIREADSLETIAEKVRGPFRRTSINDQLGILLFKRGQYRASRALLEKHFTTASISDRNLPSDLVTCRWLINADSALGDKAAAVAHYEKYTRLLDSGFKLTSIRQAEELQVMYETKEKESQIALLHEQAAREKADLKQTTLLKDLTLVGIAAVLVIAGLLYRQNRLKQRNNQVITDKNNQLQHLLTDREWLLKEIHHRVKNNLQIVMSLLNSQAVYIHNNAARAAIQDSKRRVYAMSLIHQKLYQSKNIASIAMPEYINELVNHVQDSFGMKDGIVIEQDIELLDLDVTQAIPLALIINECLVNAIKYAFPDDRPGTVRISLHSDEADHLLLTITDDGTGLPAGFDKMDHNSLGLDLVKGLARQLKGSFHCVNDDGLRIMIRFASINNHIRRKPIDN